MLYGNEIWVLNVELMTRFVCMEMRMLRWMSGVFVREHYSNVSCVSNVTFYEVG